MDKKNMERLKIKFVGDYSWRIVRDLLVQKMIECQTEEEFSEVIELLMASMFKNVKEMNKARKEQRLKLLSKMEKRKIKQLLKVKK